MKNFKLLLTLFVVPLTALLLNGCILDAFNEITQNLAIQRSFNVSGNTNSAVTQSGTFSLNDSQLFRDNQDKIKQMRYKAAAFCVTSNTVPSLQGTIILTLKTSGGILLFTKTLTGFRPNDYVGIQAKDLDLTSTEIAAINTYLSNISLLGSIPLVATLQMQNITPANTQASMNCFISLAIEMTINP